MLLRQVFPPEGGTPPQVRNLKRIAFFPQLGVAFNRLQKNGNSFAMTLLHFLESGCQVDAKTAKKSSNYFFGMGVSGVIALKKAKKIVVVRDPFSRTLSAFLEKFTKSAYQHLYGPFELSPRGFSAFLRKLETGGLRANPHWAPQTDRIALSLSHYDAVIPFSEFPTQFFAVLRELVPGAEKSWSDLPPAIKNGPRQTNAAKKVSHFYSSENIARIERLYWEDFELTAIQREADRLLEQSFRKGRSRT